MINEDELRAAVDTLVDVLVRGLRATTAEDRPKPEQLLSVAEAATALGIGKTMAYQEIAAGRLRSIKAGRRRLVPETSLSDWLHDHH